MGKRTRVTIPLLGMVEGLGDTTATGAALIENLRRDPEGYWRPMPGVDEVGNAGAGRISAMTWFQRHPSRRYLVFEQVQDDTHARIRYLDQTGTPVNIVQRRRLASGDLGTLFLEDEDWLYMISPTGAPQRWDGERLVPVGFTRPAPAPKVAGPDQAFNFTDRASTVYAVFASKYNTRQRGVGAFPDGTVDEFWRYGYAAVQVNDRGQLSPPSPVVFASGTNNSSFGRYMVRIEMPRSPDHIRGVFLLRTGNLYDIQTPSTLVAMYYLKYFPTGAAFDWCDTMPDSELGNEFLPDSVGPIPLAPRAGVFWQGSLWLADGQRVRYSTPGKVEQFPLNNYFPTGSSRTGPVVALAALPRGLAVYKPGAVHMIKGTPTSGYRIDMVTELRGCVAPRAIEYLPSVGQGFLAHDGPAILQGSLEDDQPSAVIPLPGIRRTWRRRVGSRLETAVSSFDQEHNELWWHVPEGGAVDPSLGIVYHVDIGQWTLREGWPISAFARYRGRTWIGTSDATYNGIHVLTDAAPDRFGANLNGRYVTAELFSEGVTTLQTVELGIIAFGGSTLAVSHASNRSAFVSNTGSGRAQLDSERDFDVWGTGLWGAAYLWGDLVPTVLPVDLHHTGAFQHQVKIASANMRLFSLAFIVDDHHSGDRRRRFHA